MRGFLRYVSARLRQKRDEETYRIYLTDALFASVNGGQHMTKRYFDIIHPAPEVEEQRSPEEIKSKISDGLRRLTA